MLKQIKGEWLEVSRWHKMCYTYRIVGCYIPKAAPSYLTLLPWKRHACPICWKGAEDVWERQRQAGYFLFHLVAYFEAGDMGTLWTPHQPGEFFSDLHPIRWSSSKQSLQLWKLPGRGVFFLQWLETTWILRLRLLSRTCLEWSCAVSHHSCRSKSHWPGKSQVPLQLRPDLILQNHTTEADRKRVLRHVACVESETESDRS